MKERMEPAVFGLIRGIWTRPAGDHLARLLPTDAESLENFYQRLKTFVERSRGPLDGYVELLEAARRFSEAEEVLIAQLQKPLNPTQRVWLLHRQNQCYHSALREEGQVSLGQGETLYQNLYAHIKSQLAAADDENHRYQSVYLLLEVFRTAKEKKYAFEKDLRAFAFDELPKLLKTQMNNYDSLITQTADSLHGLLKDMHAEQGLTSVIATHNPRLAAACDRVLRLERGQLRPE